MDQFGSAENVAGLLSFQNAAKHRLMKAELFLNYLRGQPDLPADMALAGGDPTVDQGELDAISIIQRKPVEIGIREELATRACDPEILDRSCKVHRHLHSHW